MAIACLSLEGRTWMLLASTTNFLYIDCTLLYIECKYSHNFSYMHTFTHLHAHHAQGTNLNIRNLLTSGRSTEHPKKPIVWPQQTPHQPKPQDSRHYQSKPSLPTSKTPHKGLSRISFLISSALSFHIPVLSSLCNFHIADV